jgi:DNA polymerase-3 subunit epsilon/ATP-dependent DNA helicase DinG
MRTVQFTGKFLATGAASHDETNIIIISTLRLKTLEREDRTNDIISGMPSIVCLDIETTGLDAQNDAIIEIGAVRFNGKRVEDEWSTLVNPGKPIPPMIASLTGISNEMVKNAPPIRAVIQALADFVGDAPVLGHNVRFDLSFLQRSNILMHNDVLDTYELAAALMPTASRYNLGGLAAQLGIMLPATHRALDDARCTHALYVQLYEKALQLPTELIAEFVRLSEPFDWGAKWMFTRLLRERWQKPAPAARAARAGVGSSTELLNLPGEKLFPPLIPSDHPQALDPDEVCALLEYGGPFSRYFGSYEQRPPQVEMMRAVTIALSTGQHLLVEAGTGTGKSFAYLVPAALWACQNNMRVVISTNTINLQDQLVKKDIPDLRAALGLDLRATVLKGRSNYLCPRRLELLRQRGPESMEEMRVLAKVLVWLSQGGAGDRNEINLNGPIERDKWLRISAEDEGCKAEVCVSRNGGNCPFYRNKQEAQSAHILVVNHALLLADVATGSRVLPEYNYVIVDEAHHIESATTSALSYRATQGDLARLLRELGGTSSGILGRLLTTAKEMLRPSDFAAYQQAIQRATDLVFRLEHDFLNFFKSVEDFMEDRREGRPVSPYGQQERIVPSTRTLPIWTEVEISWETARETAGLLLNLVSQLHKSIGDAGETLTEELQDLQGSLADVHRRLSDARNNLQGLVSEANTELIYWSEIQSNNAQIALQMAPLHVGPLMEQYLWNEKSSVILTSATLTTHGEFNYIRGRLNAETAGEVALGSPFDYETSALLYLVNDIAEPADANNYQRSTEQTIVRLAKATHGRMLVLFTSYAQLKRTSQAITPPLAAADIQVYEQGEGASANMLLETFREADQAVLLGTRAFWEGVDIPGEALSVLVIVKLPFDVPSDPIVAARSETFDDAFNEYSLPEAILRFRQGFGRLIRTQSDRGVVAILDRRILSKRYGKLFIESLPTCKLKVGPMADLPAAAARWLNL